MIGSNNSKTIFNTIIKGHGERFSCKGKKNFANFAIKQFSNYGVKLKLDEGRLYTNIISENWSNAKCVLVAHYDTVNLVPGAHHYNDNTSGISVLFAIADMLQNSNNRNNVKYLLTDKEELFRLGSKGFNKNNGVMLKKMLIINIDSVGYGSALKNDDVLVLYCLNQTSRNDTRVQALKTSLAKNMNISVEVSDDKPEQDFKSFSNCISISLSVRTKKDKEYKKPPMHTKNDNKIDYTYLKMISNTVATLIDNGTI